MFSLPDQRAPGSWVCSWEAHSLVRSMCRCSMKEERSGWGTALPAQHLRPCEALELGPSKLSQTGQGAEAYCLQGGDVTVGEVRACSLRAIPESKPAMSPAATSSVGLGTLVLKQDVSSTPRTITPVAWLSLSTRWDLAPTSLAPQRQLEWSLWEEWFPVSLLLHFSLNTAVTMAHFVCLLEPLHSRTRKKQSSGGHCCMVSK